MSPNEENELFRSNVVMEFQTKGTIAQQHRIITVATERNFLQTHFREFYCPLENTCTRAHSNQYEKDKRMGGFGTVSVRISFFHFLILPN